MRQASFTIVNSFVEKEKNQQHIVFTILTEQCFCDVLQKDAEQRTFNLIAAGTG
jgi:hypothetical protein